MSVNRFQGSTKHWNAFNFSRIGSANLFNLIEMTLVQSIILGVVQGIAEFLPISSSAHLILVPWIFGWSDDGGLTFDVALHFGTLISLLIYFRREWIGFAKSLLRVRFRHLKSGATLNHDVELKTSLFIIAATIPTAIIGLLLEKKAEHAFRNPPLIATALAFMGVVLWFFDQYGKKNKSLAKLRLPQSIAIGFLQGLAVIPGVSRSGVTITGGLAQGLDRTAAARFSFFLCMPIIAGACVLKLRHLHLADLDSIFIAGVSASAISGYLAIGGLIRFLQTKSYGFFAIYRIVIGLFVWGLYLARS